MTLLAEERIEADADDDELPSARTMTLAEFLALPDDGIDRWLIKGVLREGGMSRRSYRHTRAQGNVTFKLKAWLAVNPTVGGQILDGDAAFTFTDVAGTAVGVDVAYIDQATAERTPDEAFDIEGTPVLAVEIVSKSDRFGLVMDKVKAYLEAGVKVVWLLEPIFKTVTIYRPDAMPRLLNVNDELTAEPHLPGFKARVAELFGG